MLLKVLKSLFGSLSILLMAGLLGIASMAISFAVVHYLARDAVAAKQVDPALVRHANMLRDFSNELVALCNEYARKIPADPTRGSQMDRIWVERVFRSEVQFLQQRMDETIRRDSPQSIQLEAAAARCAAMARRPTDAAIRAATLREAAATVTALETWIATEELERKLSRPAIKVQFP